MKSGPPVLAALEKLTDDELLNALTSTQADLDEAHAEFRGQVAHRRVLTGILAGRGWTQRKIAAHLGISSAAVAAYMKGAKSGG